MSTQFRYFLLGKIYNHKSKWYYRTEIFKLGNIQMFHSDRGNELKNKLSDAVITTLKSNDLLAYKDALTIFTVTEATLKICMTEFVAGRNFNSLLRSRQELTKHVN